MKEDEKAALGRYVDAAARMVDLPIAPQYRDAVIANLERTAEIAKLAVADPLPDDLVAAPVFRP
jgi:hypothetical protein